MFIVKINFFRGFPKKQSYALWSCVKLDTCINQMTAIKKTESLAYDELDYPN